jgi:hypothetical protein
MIITHFYSISSSPGALDIYQFPALLHKLQGFISRKHIADPDDMASISYKSPDLKALNV